MIMYFFDSLGFFVYFCGYFSWFLWLPSAVCNRAGHYIFVLWFLLSFLCFSSPNLSSHRLDVYRTSTHGVAL